MHAILTIQTGDLNAAGVLLLLAFLTYCDRRR
jgi:hypothetical protein